MDRALAQGLLTGCIPASACIGALLSKYFLVTFTRKRCFDVMNMMSVVSILFIQTKYVSLVFLGRIGQGSIIGVGTAFVPLYIKEFIPQMNGKYGLYHQLFFTLAVVWAFIFNLILYKTFHNP